MSLKIIDLFSGAGGMSLGFVDPAFCGGFQVELAIDNDPAAVRTHHENFGGTSYCGDIEEWLANNEVPKADVVIGGPPCQGFSLLNKKREKDARRALWEPFIEIAQKSSAKIFVMENVAELSRSPELDDILAKAAEYGFETAVSVLNAADYGAPQTRKRTIVMGWKQKRSAPQFPPLPTHRDPKITSNLPVWKTVREVISDLPKPVNVEIEGPPPLNLHIRRDGHAMSFGRASRL
jgi:DNA (cytosine-5)-methyltransferase 1